MYLRIPFKVDQLDAIDNLLLKAEYDDGFIAYLNGTEITSRFAPEAVSFDSAATSSRFDVASLVPELIDLSEFKGLLQEGDNVLGFQALNIDRSDADLFLSPRLVAFDNDNPIVLEQSATIKARVFRDGIWSALSQADFSTAVAATVSDLRVSEIHYHPRSSTDAEIEAGFENADDFEFIEVLNIGQQAIDLSDTSFVTAIVEGAEEGIEFEFAESAISELAPGQRAVIVEDIRAFNFRYGTGLPVAGKWSGQLSNSSETITLKIGEETVQSFAYSDLWYPSSDGTGASLEVVSPSETAPDLWGSAGTWQAGEFDGSPGLAVSSPPGDANRDGVFDSSDLILAFQAAEFEDDVAGNSTWEEGDWNHDGDFTTSDFVVAFRFGAYIDQVAAAAGVADRMTESRVLRAESKPQLSDADLFTALDTSMNARDQVFRDWIDQV